MLMGEPEDGVRETPLTLKEKERTEVLGGGVSGFADMVRMSEPLPAPPPPPLEGRPLQAARQNPARMGASRARRRRFIKRPPEGKQPKRTHP